MPRALRIALNGHTSPETALVVEDYPYGFRLRCKIRYWIESKPGHGQRFCHQTTNPKIEGREVWNAPKRGIYSPILTLYREEETGHVKHDVAPIYETAKLDEWIAGYDGSLLDDPDRARTIEALRAALARRDAKRAAAG